MSEGAAIAGGVFCLITCVLLAILLPCSISVLDPLEYGLAYDGNLISVDKDTLYTGGRYFLGLGWKFLTFPRQQQVMVFSTNAKNKNFEEYATYYNTLVARTIEGLTIKLDLIVHYKLGLPKVDDKTKANQLYSIYTRFANNEESFVRKMVASEVRDTCSQMEAFNFFLKREQLRRVMFDNLKVQMAEFSFELLRLNILNLDFPEEFANSILKTQIIIQQTETLTWKKQTVMIDADTRRISADYDATIIKDTAMANAQASFFIKQGIANATYNNLQIKRDALLNLKTKWGFTDPPADRAVNKILTYMWIYVLRYHQANSLLLALDNTKVLKAQ